MIFIKRQEVSDADFVSLLEKTRVILIGKFSGWHFPRPSSGNHFEEQVCDAMSEAAKGTAFEDCVFKTGKHAFPDIVVNEVYGVEVKMTLSDKWISLGNSVLESTRISTVDSIYIFFGKFGQEFDARYRKYQECLSDVGVTHSPRYKIDMNLASGETIFDKLGVDYDAFRKEEFPIKRLKGYYLRQLKEGEALWWADQNTEVSADSIVKQFKNLDEDIKRRFLVEAFILFPDIFGNGNSKFEKLAVYLVTNYSAVSSSLRDSFSAGGRAEMLIGGRELSVPKIFETFKSLSLDFKSVLASMPTEKLSEYWRSSVSKNPLADWRTMAAKASKTSASDLDPADIELFFEETLG